MSTENRTNADQVVIERVFDAPITLVWEMWTDPAHFSAWYGPTEARIPKAVMDVRVGGTRLVCMEVQTPNGAVEMWFTGEYREVSPPSRLVYTESMSDVEGNILDPAAIGMPPGHPTTTEIIVELVDLGGSTHMTMTHRGIAPGSPGQAGWNMAFEKLGSVLADAAA